MKYFAIALLTSTTVYGQSAIDQISEAIKTGDSWAGKYVKACIVESGECVEIDRTLRELKVDKDGNLIEEGGAPNGGVNHSLQVVEALKAAGGMFKVGAKGRVKVVVESGEGQNHQRVEVEVEIEVGKK